MSTGSIVHDVILHKTVPYTEEVWGCNKGPNVVAIKLTTVSFPSIENYNDYHIMQAYRCLQTDL